MIDDKSPPGAWERELALMQVKRKKYAAQEQCRNAPWYYDIPAVHGGGSEQDLAAEIVEKLPARLNCIVSAVPNGTFTKSWSAKIRAKAEGVRTGYPDLVIDGLGRNSGKVFRAELKAKSRVTTDQYSVLCMLWSHGHPCGVFRSLDTLVAAMKKEGWV